MQRRCLVATLANSSGRRKGELSCSCVIDHLLPEANFWCDTDPEDTLMMSTLFVCVSLACQVNTSWKCYCGFYPLPVKNTMDVASDETMDLLPEANFWCDTDPKDTLMMSTLCVCVSLACQVNINWKHYCGFYPLPVKNTMEVASDQTMAYSHQWYGSNQDTTHKKGCDKDVEQVVMSWSDEVSWCLLPWLMG